VRRCLAIFAAVSLFTLQAESLAFHVHAAPDAHHVDDHQHGPAIHHHDDFDSARHIDEGELSPSGTVITVAVPVATASTLVIVHAVLAEALPIPELRLIGDARAIEMRSHSPPPLHNSLLRGPPSSAHS
jgi:hypothetical protein